MKPGDPYFGSVNIGDFVELGQSDGLEYSFICDADPSSYCSAASVTGVAIVGSTDFAITSNGCAGYGVTELNPGQQSPPCGMTVRFAPSASGYQTASLVLSLEGANNPSYSIPLSGTGVDTMPVVDTGDSAVCPASSSVNIDSLSLNETIPLVGLPFTINYASDRLRPGSGFSPLAVGLGGWTPSIVHHYNSVKHVAYFGDGSVLNVQAGPVSGGGFYLLNPNATELYNFNANGMLIETQDALTGIFKYAFYYNSSGLYAIKDQFSNTTFFTSTGVGMIITTPYGQMTSLTFDTNHFLASVTNPNQETYLMVNTATGLLTSFQKPNGEKSQVTYDAAGHVTKDQGAAGDFLSLLRSFDAGSMLQTVSVSNGLNQSSVYLTKATSSSSAHTITSTYGRTSQATIQNGSARSFSDGYGDSYQATETADPRFGALAPYVDTSIYTVANSNVNRVTKTTTSITAPNPSGYLMGSSILSQTVLQNDPRRLFTKSYVAATNRITTTSPLNRVTHQILNANAQTDALQSGTLAPISFTYDSKGRLTQASQGPRNTTLSYDSLGNVSSFKNPLGQTTQFTYDKANRVVQQQLPDNSIIKTAYDPNGNLKSITPAGRPTHLFTYNLMDLVSAYVPPVVASQSQASISYQYNLAKQLSEIDRADGSKVTFNYNPTSGLLTGIASAKGSSYFSYGANSNLVASITSADAETLTYQYAGTLPIKVGFSGPIVSGLNFTYNSDSTLASVSVGSGKPQVYAYDLDGLVVGVGNETLMRNDFGAVTISSIGKLKVANTYDSFGNLISVQNEHLSFNYVRDGLGRVTSKRESRGRKGVDANYQYDADGRLIQVATSNRSNRVYKYDHNGNRIEADYGHDVVRATYDDQDRLLTYGNLEFRYNANGEVTEKIEHKLDRDNFFAWHHYFEGDGDKKVTRYAHDDLGSLKEVVLPDGQDITYLIDGQNRRVGKKVNGRLVAGYIYQNQTQIVGVLGPDGSLIKQFIYGEKANVPDFMIYRGREYRILSDQVGTPKAVIDVASDKVVEEIFNDEFGYHLNDFERPHLIPFGFAGGLEDADTHLVKFGARDYDASTGRWTNKDPILFAGGDTNLYGYVLNDPVNLIDPSGNNPLLIVAGGGVIGGFSSAAGTYKVGGTFSQVAKSFGTGFVGGAIATATAVFAPESVLFQGLGIATDFGITALLAPTNFPNGVNMTDFGNGLKANANSPCP